MRYLQLSEVLALYERNVGESFASGLLSFSALDSALAQPR